MGQDSKTEEQNVPSYDKHRMSNHSLIPPSSPNKKENTQAETEIYRDVQNSNNNLKIIAIHYKEQESTLSDNPKTSSQCKSSTKTKEIEDLYLTQNVLL